MESNEEVSGYVSEVLFRNVENEYSVLIIKSDDGSETTVTGIFPGGVSTGTLIKVKGSFFNHASYGRQFRAVSFEEVMPDDTAGIERYLGSGLIKGIGPALAKRIVSEFGRDTIRIIEEEPERLAEVRGISENKAMSISDQIVGKREMRSAMIFLQELGVNGQTAINIYKTYGSNMKNVIRTNPYQVAEDVDGVGFMTADRIASKLGVFKDSEFRTRAAVIYILERSAKDGNTFLPSDILRSNLSDLMGKEPEGFQTAIDNLLVDGKINVVNGDEIYLSYYYNIETDAARRLIDLDDKPVSREIFSEGLIDEIERSTGLSLEKRQREAVKEALKRGVFILTGGPGTGKTTTIKAIIEALVLRGDDVALAAPTGRAARRMTEATGHEAKTIHRLLEVQPAGDDSRRSVFSRNEDNPIEYDAIIIDEMSMVDISLFDALLRAVGKGTRLIMSGDVNQLPSVGPGNVLKDIIDSDMFSVIRLETIFRQAQESDIIMNAHRINNGEPVTFKNDNDFFFMERDDSSHVIKIMLDLVMKNLPSYLKIKPQDIQVLTPMKKGKIGAENLNKIFQRYLNPQGDGKNEYTSGDTIFREGDKVMQIRNDYQLEWKVYGVNNVVLESGTGVFNGDCGIIEEVNPFDETVTVRYEDDHIVSYGFEGLEDLMLSYAVTIHKSQGSEYPAVVMPVMAGPRPLMTRNILYTAVTRAKKCVVLVGEQNTFKLMEGNVSDNKRYSGLKDRIIEEIRPV
jgi:exodeoxyribonuclease V alpha subunit